MLQAKGLRKGRNGEREDEREGRRRREEGLVAAPTFDCWNPSSQDEGIRREVDHERISIFIRKAPKSFLSATGEIMEKLAVCSLEKGAPWNLTGPVL